MSEAAGGSSATHPRIIVALDFPDATHALALAARLDPERCRLKVGKQLFTHAGPDIVRVLIARGFDVFLDLKFHDIPNTVAGACRAAAELGVWMLNVHAAGGPRMLAAARDALRDRTRAPLLIAVTVLTSMDEQALADTGVACTPERQVQRLAVLAAACGMDGVVCAGSDLKQLQACVAPDFLRVTPGIRPAHATRDDQRRVVTPAQAVAAGAHYLVVGRPVTAADAPLSALEAVETEIAGVVSVSG